MRRASILSLLPTIMISIAILASGCAGSAGPKTVLKGGPYYYKSLRAKTNPILPSERITKEEAEQLAESGSSYGMVYYDDHGRMTKHISLTKDQIIWQTELEYYEGRLLKAHTLTWTVSTGVKKWKSSDEIQCFYYSENGRRSLVTTVQKREDHGKIVFITLRDHRKDKDSEGAVKDISLEEFNNWECPVTPPAE